MITTEACLLSAGRNPHLTKNEVEAMLMRYLAIDKVIWLPNGIYLDETNEHVDNIVHYCGPATVAVWPGPTTLRIPNTRCRMPLTKFSPTRPMPKVGPL